MSPWACFFFPLEFCSVLQSWIDAACVQRSLNLTRVSQLHQSGLRLDHSRTMVLFKPVECYFSSVLGSLFCWKVNLHPSLKPLKDSNRFLSWMSVFHFIHLFFESDQFLSSCSENYPHCMMMPKPCFPGVLSVMKGLPQTWCWIWGPKSWAFGFMWQRHLRQHIWVRNSAKSSFFFFFNEAQLCTAYLTIGSVQ